MKAKQTVQNKKEEIVLEELWNAAVFDASLFEKLTLIAESEEQKKKILTSQDFYMLLTSNRNRNLISDKEQKKLEQSTVGFFGLSVGSHAAITWILESRAKAIKIIDPDVVGATNLNRLRLPWSSIGTMKTDVTEQIIKDIHPFCSVYAYSSVSDDMYNTVFESSPVICAVVDEIDDIKGKILLRQFAKKCKIPLLSATDVGDNVLLDIERYDVDTDVQPFLGRVKNINAIHPEELNLIERVSLILQIVGLEHSSLAMLESLQAIGKSIETWPQLAATSTIAGGVVTTALKKILLGEHVVSGRYVISMDTLLSSPESLETKRKKAALIAEIYQSYPFFHDE